LKNGMDKQPLPGSEIDSSKATMPVHENIRGSEYYH